MKTPSTYETTETIVFLLDSLADHVAESGQGPEAASYHRGYLAAIKNVVTTPWAGNLSAMNPRFLELWEELDRASTRNAALTAATAEMLLDRARALRVFLGGKK